mmetsp:Transcript_10086/g.33091  ORF Transcript_10086/g.33091 Transcript_10086/m.33091 type:complete len:218 (-) Transcript_10086:276-929(-)
MVELLLGDDGVEHAHVHLELVPQIPEPEADVPDVAVDSALDALELLLRLKLQPLDAELERSDRVEALVELLVEEASHRHNLREHPLAMVRLDPRLGDRLLLRGGHLAAHAVEDGVHLAVELEHLRLVLLAQASELVPHRAVVGFGRLPPPGELRLHLRELLAQAVVVLTLLGQGARDLHEVAGGVLAHVRLELAPEHALDAPKLAHRARNRLFRAHA